MFRTIRFNNPEPPRMSGSESMTRTLAVLRKAGLNENAEAIERALDRSQPGWRAEANASGTPVASGR